jgi:hypothetical protein
MKPAVIITLYVIGAVVLMAFIKLVYTFSLAENSRPQQDDQRQVASLLRCLVLYSQWLLLVASLNISWPASIAFPVQVLAWFWSTANSEALSFSCLLSSTGVFPASAQRVLFYVVLPVAVLLVLLLEILLARFLRKRVVTAAARMVDRLASVGMVVVFFFLPSMLRTVFGLFVCITLDAPVLSPYSAQAVGAFWVYDVSTHCFSAGWHRALALGMGIPLMLLLCIGLPSAIILITVSNRGRLHDPAFARHWGFLTHSYRSRCCWWEAVLVCETVALVTVGAFGISVGALYQCILMTAVLTLVMHLLLVCRPYAHATAARCMLHAVQCLFLTSFVGLTFMPVGAVRPSTAYALAMGAVLLAVHVAFIGSVVVQLLFAVQWQRIGMVLQKWSQRWCPCLNDAAGGGGDSMPRFAGGWGAGVASRLANKNTEVAPAAAVQP